MERRHAAHCVRWPIDKRRPAQTYLVIGFALAALSAAAAAGDFVWPPSAQHLDWVVLDQFVLNYVDDPRIAPLAAPIITGIAVSRPQPWPTPNPYLNYSTIAGRIGSENPNVLLGTILSGGELRADDVMQTYPGETIDYGLVPGPSFIAGLPWTMDGVPQYTVDLTMPAARSWFAGAIVAEVQHRLDTLPPPRIRFLFLDNVRHPSTGFQIPRGPCRASKCFGPVRPPVCDCVSVPWSDTLDFLARIRSGLRPMGVGLVVNVAGITFWPDLPGASDIDALAAIVDGFVFEAPLPKESARRSLVSALKEFQIYRRLLDAGKLLLLVPTQCASAPGCPECTDGVCPPCAAAVGNTLEQRLMAAVTILLREPNDAMYVARDFYRSWEPWTTWPERLGSSAGELTILGDQLPGQPIVLQRVLERGVVTADLTASLCVSGFPAAVDVRLAPRVLLISAAPPTCPGFQTWVIAVTDGTPPLQYQWRHNGVAVPGATGPAYYPPRNDASIAGSYTTEVSNAYGAVQSAPVSLVIYDVRPGDANGDGSVNNFDVDAFLAVLFGHDADPAHRCACDVNQDAAVDNFDISGFVLLLIQ